MYTYDKGREMKHLFSVSIALCLCSTFTKPVEAWNPVIDTIWTIKNYGKTIDWSYTNDLIAFARLGVDTLHDVHVMNPDGSDEICLTQDAEGCPQKQNGCPVWHPAGEYLVFTAQNEDCDSNRWAQPGKGLNCNLWAMKSDGSRFWQLTYVPTLYDNVKGVIHPQFSHDGTKLLWAQRLGYADSCWWGEWAVRIADFVIGADTVYLENKVTHQPGDQHLFYETHAFSIDDSKAIFSGNLVTDQPEYGLDIYEFDYSTQDLTRLTTTLYDWDEHADCSPDSARIAWMSSTGCDSIPWDLCIGPDDWKRYLITELWLMNTDGENQQRLTYFNEEGHQEYMGTRSVVSDLVWSPDGKRIVLTVAYEADTITGQLKSKIMMAQLAESSIEEREFRHSEDVPWLQLCPNPFFHSTIVTYYLPVKSRVSFTIHDVTGREVKIVLSKKALPGTHSVAWNAERLTSGIYFAHLSIFDETGANHESTKKLILVR
jgi:Tol biopolymer transport system component